MAAKSCVSLRASFVVGILLAAALEIPATAQCDRSQLQRLAPSDGADQDRFGLDVSLSGDTLMIGASLDDDGCVSSCASGSVYVFERTGTVWTEVQKLTASNAAGGDQFGTSVSVQGHRAAIGAVYDDHVAVNAGSVYIFEYNGTSWNEVEQLLATTPESLALYGLSVSLDGDRLIVGAGDEDGEFINQGAAYIYHHNGTCFDLENKIHASDAAISDFFGRDVSLAGGRAIVGATGVNVGSFLDAGAAYIFDFDGENWQQTEKLTASDAGEDHFVGRSVAIDGDVALVGMFANPSAVPGIGPGSAYAFRFDGLSWVEEQVLQGTGALEGDNFGTCVAVEGDFALVTAPDADFSNAGPGSGFLYHHDGSAWIELQQLTAQNAVAGRKVGSSCAIEADTVLLGAPDSFTGGDGPGSAYVYAVPDLAQDADPRDPNAGDTLTLTTCGSTPAHLVLLSIARINGTPTFVNVSIGLADSNGRYSLAGPVPAGLGGISADFQSLGFHAPGTLVASDLARVVFQ
jgi:hypothetical protein